MNEATPARTAKPFFFWLILALGAAAAVAQVAGAVWLARYGASRKSAGWNARYERGAWVVSRVEEGGPAAALMPGDRVLAVDGEERAAAVGPFFALRRVPADRSYEIRVSRGGEERTFTLRFARVARTGAERGYLLSLLGLAIAFLATALVIGLLKPDDAVARWGSLALYLPSFTLLDAALYPLTATMSPADYERFLLIPDTNPYHLAVAFGFYSFFPGIARGRAATWALRAFAVLGVLLWASEAITRRILAQTLLPFPDLLDARLPALLAFDSVDGAFSVLAFASICVVIAARMRLAKEPDQQRRMRWVAYGSLCGLVPWLVYEIVWVTAGARLEEGSAFMAALNRFANLALVVVPVITAFAIVKHRLFDINVVVRRGLRYLLARNVLYAAIAIPIVALALDVFRRRDRTLEDILFHGGVYFYLSAAGVVLLVFRRRLREALDRRFFRAAYDREAILVGLARDVGKLDSFSEVSRLVSRELDAALHPRSLHVFQRETARPSQVLVFSSGESTPSPRIPDDAGILRIMEGEERARDYPFAGGELDEGEKRWLEELGVTLVVPMNGTDQRLVGLILLGEKRSEEPYGASDRRLLQAIASQMALCRENSLLKGKVESEQRYKQEVLSRFEEGGRFVKECPVCGACFDGSDAGACAADGATPVASLPIERTLAGRYRLERLIGRGGMGAVYEARDVTLGRSVAVKIVIGHQFVDRQTARRFEREARASARLNHPNIIAVHDYGTLEGQGAFLVMELVRGRTLRSELAFLGRLDPSYVAECFAQILDGVKAAHASGVVHRDLKPENVLIRRDPDGKATVKVLDFGLAKVSLFDREGAPQSLTFPGTVLGTFGYMSPEQLSGSEVDERSDVFSLGVLVVEALTGRLPFRGATAHEMAMATLTEPFRFAGDAPEARRLDEVLQRCLAKEPAGRFASVSEMAEALLPALQACPASAIPGGAEGGGGERPTERLGAG